MGQFNLYERTEAFSIAVIEALEKIPYRRVVGIISDQLMRSATSVGANLSEADNSRSRKEFISGIGICLKEIKETLYWIRLLKKCTPQFDEEGRIFKEASELKLILGSIYNKSRS